METDSKAITIDNYITDSFFSFNYYSNYFKKV
jgi:hypothetical protein